MNRTLSFGEWGNHNHPPGGAVIAVRIQQTKECKNKGGKTMKAKRLLAVLLSIVMTLSVLPAAAFAADRSAAAEEPMRVFHLD